MQLIGKSIWTLLFMIDQTAILILPPLVLIVGISFFTRNIVKGNKLQALWFLTLLIPPILMAAWSGLNWNDWQNGWQRDTKAEQSVLVYLFAAEVVLSVALVVLLPGRRLWAALFSLLGLWIALLFWFIGVMAISGSWL